MQGLTDGDPAPLGRQHAMSTDFGPTSADSTPFVSALPTPSQSPPPGGPSAFAHGSGGEDGHPCPDDRHRSSPDWKPVFGLLTHTSF